MPSSSHPGAKPPRARQNPRPQQRLNTRPNQRGGRQQQQHERPKPPTQVMLYGMHPVIEALNNPARRCRILWLDQGKERELTNIFQPILDAHDNPPPVQWTSRDYIAKESQSTPDQHVPHQGVMLRCAPLDPLDEPDLLNLPDGAMVLALDQVTDPHNVGAMIRSAVAFGAQALVTTDRNTPYESGLMAKTASGGMDRLPWARVKNLGDTLEQMRELGFIVIGLDGNTDLGLPQLPSLKGQRVVLVMGAEGSGLRTRTKGLLDHCVRLPTLPDFPHLNVSNAAAIALYEIANRLKA